MSREEHSPRTSLGSPSTERDLFKRRRCWQRRSAIRARLEWNQAPRESLNPKVFGRKNLGSGAESARKVGCRKAFHGVTGMSTQLE